jgi:hypothetical protein
MRALILLPILVAATALAGEKTVRPNAFQPGQYDIYEGGSRVGTARQSPFNAGETNVYDRDGRHTETVRENAFKDDTYDVTRDGRRTGSVEKNAFDDRRYDVRDADGHPTGTLRESPFADDTYDLDTDR